jgi:predicted amidohydrolase
MATGAAGGEHGVTDDPEAVRVAVAQASPVFLDRDATLDRALRLIGGAASQGALLVVFGEAWIPGYPIHAWSPPASALWWELAAQYLDQSLDFAGPTVDELCAAARKADIDVIIGLAERDPATGGSVYSTVAVIGREGQVVDRHRKLRPTAYERVVWADGDALGLQVHDRGYANVSTLLSSEHQMVLPTYALAEQGSQIHAACWPGHVSPARTMMWPDQQLLSRAFAAQTGAYVLCAGVPLSRKRIPEKYQEFLTEEFAGGSVIIDPRGDVIAGPIDGEDLIVADCSLATVRAAKVAFDCAGHSSRRDQLRFTNQAQDQATMTGAMPNMPADDVDDADKAQDEPASQPPQ